MATIPVTSLAVGHEALLRALEKWCECEFNKHDELVRICPSHESLGHALFVVHMEYGRQIADTLVLEKWCVDLKDAMRPRDTEPEPYLVSEYAWSVLREVEDRD